MKLMQTNKGEFGYLKRERKRRIIIAAILLGVPLWAPFPAARLW